MKARSLTSLFGLLMASAVVFTLGCNASAGATVSDAGSSTSAPTAADPNFKPADPAAKAAVSAKIAQEQNAAATGNSDQSGTAGAGATMPKDGEKVAVIETNLGRIIFKFLPDKAPKTVANFQKLAGDNFYDGTKFHRVIPGFMIQGGDPNTKGEDRSTYGMGNAGYNIDDEFSDVHHVRGIVSMAHSGAPNSGSSQFFICVGNAGYLDGKYSAFGQVVQGMDVADKIVNLDRDANDDPTTTQAIMRSVKIDTWPVKV